MFAATLALLLTVQDPTPKPWVDAGLDPRRPEAVVVTGTAELTARESYDSAIAQARDSVLERWQNWAERELDQEAPFWWPTFYRDRTLREWQTELQPRIREGLRVLDREDRVRDHGFGKSYQTSLLVHEDPGIARAVERRLDSRIRYNNKMLAAKSGGIVLFWGLVSLLTAWLDRLSRGYMTWRLRLTAMALGIVVPVAVLLF
jgi:hypothetical protein